MNYLSVENLSKTYGEKILFENISFGLEKGQKTALIARNGKGKTTLLRILAGEEIADSGNVVFKKDLKVAYLPQNPFWAPEQLLIDYLFAADNRTTRAIRSYEEVMEDLSREDSGVNRKRLEECMAQMDMLSAWDYEGRVKEVLGKLQLHSFQQRMGELSGGQKKKAALAKVLIEEVDLMIMDEPTNHLDVEMIEWLEDYLGRQNLSLLLVTHDRTFLDAVCSQIIELDRGNLYTYQGNYSYFLEKKAERETLERLEAEKAKNLYRRELDWMRRMPSARGTKAKARKDAFYELKEKAFSYKEEESPSLSVQTERLGGKILEVYNISKSFGEKKVIDDFSYVFKKGEKIGIVGLNGAGKSTLLNILSRQLKPDSGRVVVGQTVKFGYYRQDGWIEDKRQRVIDIIKDVAEVVTMKDGTEISASRFLTYFQFDATTQYNYFSNLSGGEKRRLYLLKTLMENPNFLILDEPTNDLDVFTLMMLEEFLLNYSGCLLLVSHDRSFMNNLVDHIFVFGENGRIKDYYGNYEDYRKVFLQDQKQSQREAKKERGEQRPPREKNRSGKPTFKQKQEYERLSRLLEELETRKAEVETELGQEGLDFKKLEELSLLHSNISQELSEVEMQWLELSEIVGA